MTTPPPPSRRASWPRLLAAAVAANLVTAALYLALVATAAALSQLRQGDYLLLIYIPSLLLVPVVGGLVWAWICRGLDFRVRDVVLHTLGVAALGIAGAWIFLREGVVCLAVASPIIWLSLLCGALLGRVRFKVDRSKLNLCVIPLVAVLATGEMATRTYEREVVVDELLIHATPDKVWPHVLAFPEITEKPTYWIFRLGLPYPLATTNTGDYVGAGRRCIFSDGVVLKERVAEFVPNQRLTFDIVEQPTHPEAYGHITLHRGRFELRDNGDGTTTLIGSSWYTLHVRPLFYFDWWTRDMTRAVHLRVMRHVQRLSEASA